MTSLPIRHVSNIAKMLAFALALQAIYVAFYGGWEPSVHRAAALFFCTLIAIGAMPLAREFPSDNIFLNHLFWLVDGASAIIMGFACWRFVDAIDDMENLIAEFSTVDLWAAVGAIMVLLELTRRSFGLVLSVVGGLSLLYCLFGQDLPWIFQHSGFDLQQSMELIWYGFQGVFGIPTGIVLSLILIFIVFGALLEGTGAGEVLIRIAFAVTGGTRGGPAHAAIVASGLFGATSGSVTANVVGTGAFTIPMIKKRGFSGAFAGGVEAAASTGGQIMPPVMGVAAFLMADLTGLPYLTICIAASLPALLYYGSLFIAVSLEAGRLGIRKLDKTERQTILPGDMLKSIMLFGPIVFIMATLISGRSPSMAGFWACVSAVGFSLLLNPALRANPGRLYTALARGGVAGAKIMMAVGTIGVLLAVLNLTGIGIKFATEISQLGTSSLFLALALAAVTCLILGMGMPTLPAYLIIALVLAPTIKLLGLPVLSVHLFIFYFGILSAITPPVALAAIAAAPIAEANPITTAMKALGLAFVGFIIPFVFVYEPSLLLVLDFSWTSFIWVMARLMLAIWLISTAVVGFEFSHLSGWSRLARAVCGFAVLTVFANFQLGAFVLGLVIIALSFRTARKNDQPLSASADG